MRIEQIQQVVEVYRTGSINKAAQNLFISQPSLSAAVRTVEEELGEKLFVRTHDGIIATRFCTLFVEHAEKILTEWDEIQKHCGSDRLSPRGLRVSATSVWAVKHVFASVLEKYGRGRTDFALNGGDGYTVFSDVEAGIVELGISSTPFSFKSSFTKGDWVKWLRHKGLAYSSILTLQPVVVVGKTNPLYQKDSGETTVSCAELAPYALMGYGNRYYTPQELDLFRLAVQEIPHTGEVITHNLTNFIPFLINSCNCCLTSWVSFSSNGDFSNLSKVGEVRVFELAEAPYYYDIGYVRHVGATLSPYAREYLHELCACLDVQI